MSWQSLRSGFPNVAPFVTMAIVVLTLQLVHG